MNMVLAEVGLFLKTTKLFSTEVFFFFFFFCTCIVFLVVSGNNHGVMVFVVVDYHKRAVFLSRRGFPKLAWYNGFF